MWIEGYWWSYIKREFNASFLFNALINNLFYMSEKALVAIVTPLLCL